MCINAIHFLYHLADDNDSELGLRRYTAIASEKISNVSLLYLTADGDLR